MAKEPNKVSPERMEDAELDDEFEDTTNAEEEEEEEEEQEEPEGGEGDDPEGEGGEGGEGGPEADAVATERRARALGWAPLEEWRGDPKRWRPADEYLDRAYANRPIFEERIDKIDGELTGVKKQLSEATDVLRDMNERSRAAFEKGYNKAKQEIEARRRTAVEQGDTDAFDAADKELQDLEEQKPPAAPAKKPDGEGGGEGEGEDGGSGRQQERQVDPYLQQWVDRNSWYNEDPELQSVAAAMERVVIQKMPNLKERLDYIEGEIKKRYPEKFENQNRRAPSSVGRGSGSGSRGRGKGKSLEDLPSEAKKAYRKLKSTIPGYKVEDYIRDYYAEDNQ